MPDDLSKRGPADRTRVNVQETWEVEYWIGKWGCTKAELKAAVQAVGASAEKVGGLPETPSPKTEVARE